MKKLWITTLLSALFISITLYVYADYKEKEVHLEDLPQSEQQFITSHFPGKSIVGARIVKYGYHKIMLSDGYELLFDRESHWIEVKNESGMALPASVVGMLPQTITKYLAENYSGEGVYDIERSRKGYEVELQNVTLHFDSNGRFIRAQNDQ